MLIRKGNDIVPLFLFMFAVTFFAFYGSAEARLKVGETVQYGVELQPSATGQETTHIVSYPGSSFIRPYVILSLESSDTVQLFNKAGVLRATYDSSRNGAFWAHSVDGDEARIVLNASPGNRSSLTIDTFGYGYPATSEDGEFVAESTCSTDDKTDRECHKATYRYNVANSVGRMLFTSDTGGQFVCTGSLISHQNHFITNNHCINSQAEANSLEVRFNYEYTTCGGSTTKSFDAYTGSNMLWTSSGLDATLLTIDTTDGNAAATYGYLPVSGRVLNDGDPIYIPQHPGGGRKKIAATADGVLWAQALTARTTESGSTANSSLLHNADTLGGSSGSPVLDTQNYIIALHHTGYASSPYNCTSLHPAHPTGDPADGYNGAILMSAIFPNIVPFLPADIDQNATGSCNGCSGWVWGRVEEAWQYTSGAGNQHRLWASFTTSTPGNVDVDSKANVLRALMIKEAASSHHWFGTFWSSPSAWSNSRLWFN